MLAVVQPRRIGFYVMVTIIQDLLQILCCYLCPIARTHLVDMDEAAAALYLRVVSVTLRRNDCEFLRPSLELHLLAPSQGLDAVQTTVPELGKP
jgi:hypothetical protein